MTYHHRTPIRQWHAEYPKRHKRFQRAAARIVFGKPTEADRLAYAKERAEWDAFLAAPVGDQPQQQAEQEQEPTA